MNLQLEVSSKCNLACVECPQRLMKRKRKIMDNETFEIILNEYIDKLENKEKELGYPPTIIWHKDGEPLMNPQLRMFIAKASLKRPEFRFNIYTNGLLLTEEFIDFVGSLPNLTWLFISFHFYNEGGKKNDYSKLNELMLRILNNEKEYKNIKFVYTSHVTRHVTKEELNEWAFFWKSKVPKGSLEIGINDHINPWTGLIDEPNCISFSGGCPYADFGHLFIGVTGNVLPCCMMLEEDFIFGNIHKDSSKSIYEKAEQFYSSLRQKNIVEEVCKRCLK